MSKDSKRFLEAKKAIQPGRVYTALEAANILKGMKTANFDETVEVHIKLGVNPRHAEQQVRGTVMLPHGTGKTLRVAVFAKGEKATEAEAAGADLVGAEDLAAKIEGGMLDFDACIATPDMMGVVGKLGRVLGPRGLMPNPKAGTVTFDIGKAVTDMKAGKVEYRTDKFGVVHSIIGKKSFTAEQLAANYGELLGELLRAKPAAAKGKYLRNISMSSTMGPGMTLDTSKTKVLLEDEA
jgi:large subunit ribosomal protein L1